MIRSVAVLTTAIVTEYYYTFNSIRTDIANVVEKVFAIRGDLNYKYLRLSDRRSLQTTNM